MKWGTNIKYVLDILVAASGLIVLLPLFVVVALLVKLTSPGPIFFRQQRMGRNFRPFTIYKFRTMIEAADLQGAALTHGAADPRITPIGRILRRTKIDELPQLGNVLVGQMSLVGPRPEVAKYVEQFPDEYGILLTVRPGITSPASLKYRNEAERLGNSEQPEQLYLQEILPDKIALDKEYVASRSLLLDLKILCRTICGSS